MDEMKMSKRRADAFSTGAFLISLGILFFTNTWWPGILLAIWVLLGLRQFLRGRTYDLTITSIILLGLFITSFVRIDWSIFIPVLFVIGGIYIIFREYFYSEDESTLEKIEDIETTIEEDAN